MLEIVSHYNFDFVLYAFAQQFCCECFCTTISNLFLVRISRQLIDQEGVDCYYYITEGIDQGVDCYYYITEGIDQGVDRYKQPFIMYAFVS